VGIAVLGYLLRIGWGVQHYTNGSVTGIACEKMKHAASHSGKDNCHSQSRLPAADARRSGIALDGQQYSSRHGIAGPGSRVTPRPRPYAKAPFITTRNSTALPSSVSGNRRKRGRTVFRREDPLQDCFYMPGAGASDAEGAGAGEPGPCRFPARLPIAPSDTV